jgi:hypothetical protein
MMILAIAALNLEFLGPNIMWQLHTISIPTLYLVK